MDRVARRGGNRCRRQFPNASPQSSSVPRATPPPPTVKASGDVLDCPFPRRHVVSQGPTVAFPLSQSPTPPFVNGDVTLPPFHSTQLKANDRMGIRLMFSPRCIYF